MKAAPSKKNAAALTLPQIDALVAEIADHQLTCDGLRADLAARFHALDEQLAPIKAAARPDIERVQAALAAVEKSLAERWQVVEGWADAHKDAYFQHPRSLRLLRGVIGYRLSPPKVSALKTWTLGLCVRAEFQARPERLAAVGLQITQTDVFYLERTQEGSDAFGKEAR